MTKLTIRENKKNEHFVTSRRRFTITPRDRRELPDQAVEIPSPSRAPALPSSPNILFLIMQPVIMLVVAAIMWLVAYFASQSINLIFYLIMPLIGMGTAGAQYASYKSQMNKYQLAMEDRKSSYQEILTETRFKLDALVKQQQEILEKEYPLLPRLISIGMGSSNLKRLWWRQSADTDFLSLRIGTGNGKPSFSIVSPRTIDPEDPLARYPRELLEAYQEIPRIPLLLELQKIGSVALVDRGGDVVFGVARRLMLDIIVHHSPQDVEVVVMTDTLQGQERWEWLKWAPHTRAILQGETNRKLAFTPSSIDKCLEWLKNQFENRRKSEPGVRRRSSSNASIVVLMDDSGDIRHTEDLRQLADTGREVGIYVIFIGTQNLPRECRARIEVSGSEFKYVETFAGEGAGKRRRGEIDPASLLDCERVARALAGLEIFGNSSSGALPESVRLSDVLLPRQITTEVLKENWLKPRSDDELLQFPFGLRVGRKGLEPVVLNLLPPGPDYPGIGAYHTILVGTTGSGKSEFMKTLVLSAAHKYSPKILNFFFMDFKGGAAFNILEDLPHVVGVVTNLNPQLVERGLSALEAEFERRQKHFADAAVANIWSYNAHYPGHPMPHLLLLLDEFARGMNDFPRLPDMLDKLVRIGRSLGVYLMLANQDVNAAVDRLLNNVGWHIALKVSRQEEMHIIDRSLPKVERTGQGYLHSQDGDIYEFQAAYAGFSVPDTEEKVEESFRIYQVGEDGKWQSIYSNILRPSVVEKDRQRKSEQDLLISSMGDLSNEIEPALPIYLEPLEPDISLDNVLQESGIQRAFANGEWDLEASAKRLVAPIGYTDSTEECIQECLQVDFKDQDGHLWIIGGASSGKAMTIESTLLSLATTHSPEDVWFYILEFGAAGSLRIFRSLPHCGVVITQKDPVELLDRLLRFLDDEMNRRSVSKADKGREKHHDPEIFLVINNFSEFRTSYPDHADRIAPYINGKAMGIHLIIATNRRVDLPSKLVIARKVVLRLANRDEYSDAIGGRVTLLPTLQAEGRGLWVDKKPLECQVAQPMLAMSPRGDLNDAESICEAMVKAWRGRCAAKIKVLSKEIPLDEAIKEISISERAGVQVPIGYSFENMELVTADMLMEYPRWLVLGPPRSGKSNFLSCLANTILARHFSDWEISYLSLRRSAPLSIDKSVVNVASTVVEATQVLTELVARLGNDRINEKRILVLIDDLGAGFEPGRETLPPLLNSLALKISSRDDIFIVAAGASDELKLHQVTSQFVRIMKQGRTGIGFYRDSSDMELLGTPIPFSFRNMDLPPGRGFWVSGGKYALVQSPYAKKIMIKG